MVILLFDSQISLLQKALVDTSYSNGKICLFPHLEQISVAIISTLVLHPSVLIQRAHNRQQKKSFLFEVITECELSVVVI